MNLESIRQEIDSVDDKLVELLEKRLLLVSQVAESKKNGRKAVLDLEREKKILESVAGKIHNKDFEPAIVATFSTIMKQSRDYQKSKGLD